MTISQPALRVYATLQSLKGRSEDDVIDALLPFTIPVLEILNGKPFTPELLAAGLGKLYGWSLTTGVAEVFQRRLEARGYLVKPQRGARILLVALPEGELLGPTTYSSEIDDVVEAFIDFSKGLGDLLHFNRKPDQALDILVKFLITLDLSSPTMNGKAREVPELLRGLPTEAAILSPDDRYICARFVDSVSESDSNMFDKLAKLAAVGMLTEVVQDFVGPREVRKSNLHLVLDAPVALEAVGVSGRRAQQDIRLMLDAATKLGCKVSVFRESCNEMSRTLRSVLQMPRPKRFGPTHTALVKGEVREEYVQLVQRNPEKAIRDAGINISSMSLDSHPSLHKFFPEKTYEAFKQSITWKLDSPDAIKHDAVAMTLTCRLREGERDADLFQNRYLFVTTNGAFSRLSHSFSQKEGLIEDRDCPPAIQHTTLATACWLRTGLGGSNELPTAHLLAHCERVLSLRREVVERARQVLREIKPDEEAQLDLLLQDARSVTKLMDLTLNDEDRVSETSVPAMLDEMRRATAAEIEEEYKAKLEQSQQQHREAASRAKNASNQEHERQRGIITGLEEHLQRIQEDTAREQAEDQRQIAQALADANREVGRARTAIISVTAVVTLLLLANQMFGWVDINNDAQWLVVAGTVLSAISMLQHFFRWPSWGFGDLLSSLGRTRYKRKLEQQGLVRAARRTTVSWKFGNGTINTERER